MKQPSRASTEMFEPTLEARAGFPPGERSEERCRELWLAIAAMLLAFMGSADVRAAEFCEDYADQALVKAEQAALYPSCALTGPGWETDRDEHLAWCEALDGPKELATVELAKRHAALIACLMSVTTQPSASSVTKATDSDAAGGKIDGESDHQETGDKTPIP